MMQRVAGVDEVGRGCLAGAVFAAAVVLDPNKPIAGLKDSKKISEKQREALALTIKRDALCWAVARAEPSEIDRINILHAALLAMARAIAMIDPVPDWIIVDGNRYPPIDLPGEAMVKADSKVPAVSAASILAKVARDREMLFLERLYPGYGFNLHKGYPTPLHRQQLMQFGITPFHRKSFAPVKALIK
ncbi:ribonuclease HII [Methylotuvimicrobium sp.]|uniref:ribonuclease HII n=1 Tax=Methylotuvimicrobium sp. TaxID=2822413 RepID=UPI003D64BB11